MPTHYAHLIAMVIKEFPKAQQDFIEGIGAEEIGDIIISHSIGAAAASAASGWIPGVGGTAAVLASVGFIWSMYTRINKRMGISISNNKVKSLASAVLTNITASAASLIVGVVASTALSFLPGIGNIAASVIMAGLNYGVVFASGIMYLKILVKLFKAQGNINEVSEETLKDLAKDVVSSSDVSSIINEAQKEYRDARKKGTITGKEKIDLEKD